MAKKARQAPAEREGAAWDLPRQQPLIGAQRALLAGTLVVSGFVFSRSVVDQFSLPRAYALVAILIALAGLSAVRGAQTGRVSIPRSPLLPLSGVFLVVMLLTVVLSDHPMRSAIGPYSRYSGLIMYATYAGLMAFVIRAFDRRSMPLLAETATAVLLFVGAYGLLQHLDLDPIDWPLPEDASAQLPTEFATFGNVNFAAGFIGVLAPLALWRTIAGGEPWKRLVAAGAFGIALIFSVLSESAQGVLALLAGSALVVGIVAWERRSILTRVWSERRRAAFGLGAVALAGLAATAVLLIGYLSEQFADAGGRERRQLWGTAVDLWQEQPVLGHGAGAFAWLFTSNRPRSHATANTFLDADAPHSVFLDMAVSGGAVLFLAYLAVVLATGYVLVTGLRRAQGEHRLLLGAFGGAWIGYQVQSLVSIDVPPLAVLHWALTGAIVVLGRQPRFWTLSVSARARTQNNRAARRRSASAPKASTGPIVAVVLACLVLLWVTAWPVRADRASARALEARAQGEIGEMRAQADRAVDLAPWEARYWAQVAAAADLLGDLPAAKDAGLRAAARAPGSSFYALAVAGIAERLEDEDEAERWLREAQRRDPFNPRVAEAVAAAAGDSGSDGG